MFDAIEILVDETGTLHMAVRTEDGELIELEQVQPDDEFAPQE